MSQANIPSSRDELIAKCLPFLEEVKDLTTGNEVEQWLNNKYGTSSEFYKDLKRLITIGVVEEGWAANVEISGRQYRRARLVEPSEETFGFSIKRWPRSFGQFFRFLSGVLGGHAADLIAGSIAK